MMRQFSSTLLRLAAVVTWLSLSDGVSAEPAIATEAPATFVAGDRSFLAPSPGARGDTLFRAAIFVDYARAPLKLVSADQQVHAVVEEQLWLHPAASISLHHRWLFALHVPVLLRQRGEASPRLPGLPAVTNGPALGDPELMLRGRVLGKAEGFALGVGATTTVPLSGNAYAGAPGPAVGGFAAAGHDSLRSFSAFAVGFRFRQPQVLPGVLPTRAGAELHLALAAGMALDPAHSTRVGPELAVHMTVGDEARLLDPRSTVGSLLVHLQHRLWSGPFEVGIAGGPGIGRGPGAADYRALLNVVFSPEEPVPPPDSDGDRIADESDMCPSLAGERSEDPMMDGCPAIPPDADGDGIPDALDACPRTVGVPSVLRNRHGCPKLQDRDEDSIADSNDACPDERGVFNIEPTQHGCPPPARREPPSPRRVTVEERQIAISEQVQFESGTAQLRDQSTALLEEVAAVLRKHPEIEACEVAGHTDNTGTPEFNQQLSEQRAQAVRKWLITRSIDARRLTTRGYGDTRPIADNATAEGRARNRRVEFVIVRRASVQTGLEER